MIQSILTTALTTLMVVTPSPSATSNKSTNQNWEKLQQNALTIQPPIYAQAKTYTVKPGDSLGSIAQSVYGTSDDWIILWTDNAWIDNPNALFSDWQLSIRDNTPPADQNVLPNILKQKLASLPKVPVESAVPSPTALAVSAPQSTPVANTSTTPSESPGATASATPRATADFGSSAYDDVYKVAGAKFGVPWQILYGIHMTETGCRNGDILNHSGSGAEGPMQFMPGTFRVYAEDGDSDGKADIANAADAIYTAANYLAKHDSLAAGLRSYGGNTAGTLSYARSRGWDGSI